MPSYKRIPRKIKGKRIDLMDVDYPALKNLHKMLKGYVDVMTFSVNRTKPNASPQPLGVGQVGQSVKL
jgi:hypothetical protein